MAPQELNVAIGTKRSSQLQDLFAFPFPKKRKKNRKKKQAVTSICDLTNDQPEISKPAVKLIEVINLDSDDSHDKFEKSDDDDDVVLLETPTTQIDLSDNFGTTDVPGFLENEIVLNIVDDILEPETRALNASSPPLENHETESEVNQLGRITDYPKTWTKEMIEYYTKPIERYRNFDYVEVLKTIESKPSDWYINAADKYGLSKQKRRYIPCRKCQKIGHTEKECRKNIVCYVCGQFNHVFNRCPNTLCLMCGRPSPRNTNCCDNCHRFISTNQPCALCGQMYHSEKLCPSKWRQHLILSDSNVPAKPNPRKFCYNCAGKGHFGFECPQASYSKYPPENPIITSLFNRSMPLTGIQDDNNNCKNAVIYLYQDTADRLKTEAGDKFFRNFSDQYKVCVEMFHSPRNYIKIFGRREQIDAFRRHLNQWKKEVASTVQT